jgi:hypothetical protein
MQFVVTSALLAQEKLKHHTRCSLMKIHRSLRMISKFSARQSMCSIRHYRQVLLDLASGKNDVTKEFTLDIPHTTPAT